MSALASAMCLLMDIFSGPYGIAFIAVVDLSMLSDVQAIIAADAGVQASAGNLASVIKTVLMKSLPGNETSVFAGFRGGYPPPAPFPREADFTYCDVAFCR